jgi:hypothetical protein
MKQDEATGKGRGIANWIMGRREPKPVGKESAEPSPFLVEFFMVQGIGFICMAYRNTDGKWRTAFDDIELPGNIRVLE